MGLKVDAITDLDAELVEQTQAELTQLMQDRHPTIEITRGVVHDLILYFGAIFGATSQTEVNRVLNSNSLLSITADPALADDDLVNKVLSNYNVTRKDGTNSTGEITIVVSSDASLVIPAGAVYTANGVEFTADESYIARPVGSTVQSPTDRILTANGDGNYSFQVNATATVAGVTGNITRNTLMVPTSLPGNFVTSYAATDFSGGINSEDNATLIARMNEGISAKAWAGRQNIKALIRDQVSFEDVRDMSIIGFGNEEMLRDQHWIFPVSGGGRTDMYMRTEELPITLTLQKTATLISTSGGNGVWQFALTRDDYPGFYDIPQILLLSDDALTTSGFEITKDVRSFDLTDENLFIPDILNGEEAAYTRYQTAIIQFIDTVTSIVDLTVGTATAEYNVAVRGMPLLQSLQAFASDSEVRYLAGDALVKAAVPCDLTINFDIEQGSDQTDPDISAIASALAERVNNLGFPGQLHASLIADAAHDFLTSRQAIGRVDMQGVIRQPNGTNLTIRASDVLEIPDNPTGLVTGLTTIFILDPANIGIVINNKGFELGT